MKFEECDGEAFYRQSVLFSLGKHQNKRQICVFYNKTSNVCLLGRHLLIRMKEQNCFFFVFVFKKKKDTYLTKVKYVVNKKNIFKIYVYM